MYWNKALKVIGVLSLLLAGSVFADTPLEDIHNYHQVSDTLHTAGQVMPEHVDSVANADIGLVVNLAPASEERNKDEGFLLTGRGVSYVQIPVKWDDPTDSDLQLFFAVMAARGERSTLVHCFANYRASAFTYLYRVLVVGVDESIAREDLHQVWDEKAFVEYPQWRAFIDKHLGALKEA